MFFFSKETTLFINNEFGKIDVYSPSLRQDSCQKINKCSDNFKPISILQDILNGEIVNLLIEEKRNH